jgi:hypothetical protein
VFLSFPAGYFCIAYRVWCRWHKLRAKQDIQQVFNYTRRILAMPMLGMNVLPDRFP